MKSIAGTLLLLTLFTACGKQGGDDSSPHVASRDRSALDSEARGKVVFKPSFKNDHAYLAVDSSLGKAPRFKDERYTSYRVYRNPEHTELNYKTFKKGLRFVDIQGAYVALGGADSHAVYELIKRTNDVKELTISAHTLVIEDEIHLAQTNVVIHAQKVIFKGKGKIITTPIEKSELPQLKQDGADGLDAGDITLLAREIESESDLKIVLEAKGGKGQPAGPGVDGARGRNAKIVKRPNYFYNKYYHCVYRGIRAGESCSKKKDEGWRSGNGQPAQVGGRPGGGANGGKIVYSSDIAHDIKFDNSAGASGDKDRMRKGGAPGRPVVTCVLDYGKRKSCASAAGGKDAAPKEALNSTGLKGKTLVSGDAPELGNALFYYTEYAKDLYLEKYLDLARKEFEYIQQIGAMTEVKSATQMKSLAEGESLLKNIDMRLDYFGQQKTWAPKLSFSAAAKLFEKEGEANLELYFLSKSLNRSLKNKELKQDALINLQERMWNEILSARQSVTKEVTSSSNLAKTIGDLNVARNEFDLELRRLESEIKRMAKNNLRIPFWEKAVATFSAASKVIPVGQPTFGAVGAGLDFFMKAHGDGYSAGDFARELPRLSKSFEGFNWKGAVEQLNDKMRSLDPSQLSKLGSAKEKLEYLKEVGAFAEPIFKAVKEQSDSWKEREVSRNALDREINKIKRSHKAYRKVVEKLNALLAKKEEFLALARGLQSSVSAHLRTIQSHSTALAYAYDDIHDLQGKFSPEFKKTLSNLEADSKRRMRFYTHQLAKAFEYEFLQGYPAKVDLDGFYGKAQKAFDKKHPDSEVLSKLKTLFKSEISSLTEAAVLKSVRRDDLVKTVELNAREVTALNNGSAIYMDFTELEFFGGNKENVRLNSVQLDETSDFNRQGESELVFEHAGESVVFKSGIPFFFTQPKEEAAKWISSVRHGTINYSSPSDTNGNALQALLGLEDGIKVFSAPAARSFIKLTLKGDARLIHGSVRLDYSFEHAN